MKTIPQTKYPIFGKVFPDLVDNKYDANHHLVGKPKPMTGPQRHIRYGAKWICVLVNPRGSMTLQKFERCQRSEALPISIYHHGE